MEFLHNGFTLDTCQGAFPLSTDSMLLASFVRLPKNARVLDLGSGGGTLGVLLCARDPGCTVIGIELDNRAHSVALENIRRNQLGNRLQSICTDLRSLAPDSFHCCVSNPPYFSGGPASRTLSTARREDTATLQDVFDAAGKSLRYGGDFFLVHRPERLAELCVCAEKAGLEPKRLQLVHHRQGGPITLVLLACRKGGKPGLILEETELFDAEGHPSPAYRRIYHL